MPDSIHVTLDVSDALNDLDVAMDDFQRRILPRTMQRIGVTMQDVAQTRVPVVTGHLKTSITHAEGNRGLVYTAQVGSNVEYAPYVEFGTGDAGAWSGGADYMGHDSGASYTAGWPGMRAQPYLRPALYDMQDVYIRMVRDAIREALR